MKYLILISFVTLINSCNSKVSENNLKTHDTLTTKSDITTDDYFQSIVRRDNASAQKNTDTIGELISTVDFQVKTDNLEDFENGLIPWISIEKPESEISQLVDKDKKIISENEIAIIMDYPITNIYRLSLFSKNGFTRRQLIEAISEEYHRIYIEEEETATIKTIPIDKRTTMYNRNETNGKYGIWGHDLADLDLAEILIYKDRRGKRILSLNIES